MTLYVHSFICPTFFFLVQWSSEGLKSYQHYLYSFHLFPIQTYSTMYVTLFLLTLKHWTHLWFDFCIQRPVCTVKWKDSKIGPSRVHVLLLGAAGWTQWPLITALLYLSLVYINQILLLYELVCQKLLVWDWFISQTARREDLCPWLDYKK